MQMILTNIKGGAFIPNTWNTWVDLQKLKYSKDTLSQTQKHTKHGNTGVVVKNFPYIVT